MTYIKRLVNDPEKKKKKRVFKKGQLLLLLSSFMQQCGQMANESKRPEPLPRRIACVQVLNKGTCEHMNECFAFYHKMS